MNRRILLIDDDRMQYRLTQAHFKTFQSGRYTLEWAETYEEGMRQLLSGRYDACLLDYQLGEKNGLQLIRDAVAQGCHTPIVFLTAETADRVDIEAMNAGALDYLVKGEITPRMIERSLRYALKLGETLEALRRLATRDELTGLLNRREFERVLNEEEERARRFQHPLGLVMVDIDHFKSVNDTHGHAVGDEVLREVARRVAGEVRSVDRAMRYGGEELALVLVQSDSAAAEDVARRVCAAVRREPVRVSGGRALRVTVSAGFAAFPHDAGSGPQLLNAADKALYAAKAQGRDRAVAFGEVEAGR
ncbi:MAG: GGDEF domain-containing response regulator [Verrucomicrobia bacterium]|nr:GGDEF domain-containing response regulator [Verrucomicrobiota bacterium]